MWIEEIVATANANEKLMDGTTGPVIRILAENDLVFAVSLDPSERDGIGTLVLKGQRRLSSIAAEGDPAPGGTQPLVRGGQAMKWSAVKVLSLEMAVATRQTLGEAV